MKAQESFVVWGLFVKVGRIELRLILDKEKETENHRRECTILQESWACYTSSNTTYKIFRFFCLPEKTAE